MGSTQPNVFNNVTKQATLTPQHKTYVHARSCRPQIQATTTLYSSIQFLHKLCMYVLKYKRQTPRTRDYVVCKDTY